ncbi:A24 family peptidase [Vibrio splendidus]
MEMGYQLEQLLILFYGQHPMMYGFVFMFAILFGSFANVVIDRWPRKDELDWSEDIKSFLSEKGHKSPYTYEPDGPVSLSAWSSCDHCHAPIRWWMNIPVLSWFLLRARSSCCKKPISCEYPLVELGYALIAVGLYHLHTDPLTLMMLLVSAFVLLVLAYIDAHHQYLPDVFVGVFACSGLILSMYTDQSLVSLNDSILFAALSYVILSSVRWLYSTLRGLDGLGLGDVKLISAFCLWIPVTYILKTFLLATILSLLAYGLTKKLKEPHPFGPSLIVAFTICYFSVILG